MENNQFDNRIEGCSPLALKMYGFQCALLKRYFGDIIIGDITTGNVESILGEICRTNKTI